MNTVDIAQPKTFPTYKQVHNDLRLDFIGADYGKSLQAQGLNNLARWSRSRDLPAITGLIVRGDYFMPGQGFFDLYEKDEMAGSRWWLDEIAKVKNFDWSVEF